MTSKQGYKYFIWYQLSVIQEVVSYSKGFLCEIFKYFIWFIITEEDELLHDGGGGGGGDEAGGPAEGEEA